MNKPPVLRIYGGILVVAIPVFLEFHWLIVLMTALAAYYFIVRNPRPDKALIAAVIFLPLRIPVMVFGSVFQFYHVFLSGVMIASIAYVLSAEKEEFLRIRTAWIPALIFLFLMAASLARAVDFRRSFYDVKDFAFVLAFFYLVANLDSLSRMKMLVIFIVSSLPLSLLGLYQHFFQGLYFSFNCAMPGFRAMSTFDHPNLFGFYLVTVLILGSAILSCREKEKDTLVQKALGIGVISVFAVSALAVTFSRSGWICLIAGIILLFILTRRKVLLYGIAAVICGLLLIPGLSRRAVSTGSLSDDSNITRIHLARAGLKMMSDYPLFGAGQDNFVHYYEKYKPEKTVLDVSRSHVSIVTIAAELGLTGLIAFCWMIFAIFKAMFGMLKHFRSSPDSFIFALQAGLISAAAVHFLNAQINGNYWQEPYVWLCLGLALWRKE